MPVRHATLNQLKIFQILSREQSISATAKVMHLTAPAVSIQVKQLAEAAEQPLIEQIGKKIYLTQAGEEVAKACDDIFERIEHLSQDLASLQDMVTGTIRVSIITTANYFIPRLLGEFSEKHEGIEVMLFVGNREAVFDRLRSNEDDLYILGQPPTDIKVEHYMFAPNPIIAIAHPSHPLAQNSLINPEELANYPFILREQGSGTRRTTEQFFKKHDVPLKVRMELGSNEAVKQSVIAKLGMSFVAGTSVRNELRLGDLVELNIKGLPLQREWHVMHPKNKILSPAAKEFKNFLINAYEDE